MTEYLIDANDELKRADHLLYVSLKYTRTVDVIRSVIQRLINAFDFIMNGYLNQLEENNKIEELPTAPGAKAVTIKKLYAEDSDLIEYMNFYLFMRKLLRAKYTRSLEFRRHVTMTSTIIDPETDNEEIVNVKIDHCLEYYEKTKEFFAKYKSVVIEEESDLYD